MKYIERKELLFDDLKQQIIILLTNHNICIHENLILISLNENFLRKNFISKYYTFLFHNAFEAQYSYISVIETNQPRVRSL
jgi:hypothetical protein